MEVDFPVTRHEVPGRKQLEAVGNWKQMKYKKSVIKPQHHLIANLTGILFDTRVHIVARCFCADPELLNS